MENRLSNDLKRIASSLYINDRKFERTNIRRSIGSIVKYLTEHFETKVKGIIPFGSYTRGTMLPHGNDIQSDVDLMVVFSTKDGKLTPEAYRKRLQRFAELYYSRGKIVKDHPSVTIELNHLKFDMIAAVIDNGIIYDSIDIPGKEEAWIETDPNGFNRILTSQNKKYKYIVKPTIRLIKYWNASHNYPFKSYELEKQIADQDYSGCTFQQAMGVAVRNLSSVGLTNAGEAELNNLQANYIDMIQLLDNNNIYKAKQVLKKMLPGF